jgi:hypothetical protein
VRKIREPYDCDSGYTCDATKANLAIVAAQEIIKEFRTSTPDQQQAFLMLLPLHRYQPLAAAGVKMELPSGCLTPGVPMFLS